MANITVTGRLGGVPEVRAAGDKHVARFRIAETKRKFDREQNKWVDDWTIWHNCESWSNVEAIGRLDKGTLVIVEGEMKDASYTSRETNQVVPRTVIKVYTIGTVITNGGGGGSSQPSSATSDSWGSPEAVF